jgi:hypothetical protein
LAAVPIVVPKFAPAPVIVATSRPVLSGEPGRVDGQVDRARGTRRGERRVRLNLRERDLLRLEAGMAPVEQGEPVELRVLRDPVDLEQQLVDLDLQVLLVGGRGDVARRLDRERTDALQDVGRGLSAPSATVAALFASCTLRVA